MKYQNNFFPITATPFSRVGYKEVLPCRELLPYAWQAQNFADEKLAKTVNGFFEQTLSLSPKKTSSIIRYQSLWQEVCRSTQFDIQDSVFAYGYYDQAHLLNDFKKYHGISLSEARKLAFKS